MDFGTGVSEIIKLAGAVYDVSNALRSGPSGASRKLDNLKAEKTNIQNAQQQCLTWARRMAEDMEAFGKHLEGLASYSSEETERQILLGFEEYQKTCQDCEAFFAKYWALSPSKSSPTGVKLIFAKGWNAMKWAHHGEQDALRLQANLANHRAHIALTLQHLNMAVNTPRIRDMWMKTCGEGLESPYPEHLLQRHKAASISGASGFIERRESMPAGWTGEGKELREYAKQRVENSSKRLPAVYHYRQESAGGSSSRQFMAAGSEEYDPYEEEEDTTQRPPDMYHNRQFSSDSTQQYESPYYNSGNQEADESALTNHTFWDSRYSDTSRGSSAYDTNATHESYETGWTSIPDGKRPSLASTPSLLSSHREVDEAGEIDPREAQINESTETYQNVTIKSSNTAWENCLLSISYGNGKFSVSGSASSLETRFVKSPPQLSWTLGTAPYPHTEPRSTMTSRDRDKYPVIPLKQGVTYIFPDKNNANHFRSWMYGYNHIDTFEIAQIYSDRGEDLNGANVTLWQSRDDGSYHLAYVPNGSEARSRKAVTINQTYISRVKPGKASLEIYFNRRAKKLVDSTTLKFKAEKGNKLETDRGLVTLERHFKDRMNLEFASK